ncbi:hypothetical protein CLOM_g9337, partial [Closterium sp. NIES-68]
FVTVRPAAPRLGAAVVVEEGVEVVVEVVHPLAVVPTSGLGLVPWSSSPIGSSSRRHSLTSSSSSSSSRSSSSSSSSNSSSSSSRSRGSAASRLGGLAPVA